MHFSLNTISEEIKRILSYYGYVDTYLIKYPFKAIFKVRALLPNFTYHEIDIQYWKIDSPLLYKFLMEKFPNYYGLSREQLDIATMGEAFKKSLD